MRERCLEQGQARRRHRFAAATPHRCSRDEATAEAMAHEVHPQIRIDLTDLAQQWNPLVSEERVGIPAPRAEATITSPAIAKVAS